MTGGVILIIEEIGRGSTVDEAMEDGRLKLGLREDDEYEFEIITTPKKKALGLFGGKEAEVKVWVTRPDPKGDKKQKNRPENKKDGKKEIKAKEVSKKETKAKENKEAKAKEKVETVDAETLTEQNRSYKAIVYLKNVLSHLGCENVKMQVAEADDGAIVFLEGEGLGIVIGRRGETLDALQHLASLSARTKAGYYKITLNIGDYRERREDALSSLAKRIAAQVLKNGRGKALEPMNPYERRIIHTTIQEIDGVTSASLGEGENRRVVIVLEGEDVKSVRFDRRRRDDRGRNGRRPRRPAAEKITAPTREPKSDSDVPLYGKIK